MTNSSKTTIFSDAPETIEPSVKIESNEPTESMAEIAFPRKVKTKLDLFKETDFRNFTAQDYNDFRRATLDSYEDGDPETIDFLHYVTMLDDTKDAIGTCNYQHAKWVMSMLEAYNELYAVVKVSGSVGVATLQDNPPEIMSPSSFKTLLGNEKCHVDSYRGDNVVNKTVTLPDVWLDWKYRRTYKGGVVFAPGKNAREDAYNLFKGFPTEALSGDWYLMEYHIREVVCSGNQDYYNFFMSWLADIIQNPGDKPGTSIVLRGLQGVGKSKVFDLFREMIGKQYSTTVNSGEGLTGRFNSSFMQALFVQAEEAVWSGDKRAAGVLKDLITQKTMSIEKKGVDKFTIDNYSRFAMTTNEDWAVPATSDNRRFFVLDVAETHIQDTSYFAALDVQMLNQRGLEAFMYALQHWGEPKPEMTAEEAAEAIEREKAKYRALHGDCWGLGENLQAMVDRVGIRAKDAKVSIRNPPHTRALGDQILESLPMEDRFFVNLVIEGSRSGFFKEDSEHPVSSFELLEVYNDYCDKHKLTYGNNSIKMGQKIQKLWGFEKKRLRDKMSGNTMATFYIMPPLERARKCLAGNLGIKLDQLPEM